MAMTTKNRPLHSAVTVHNEQYPYLNKVKRWDDANLSNINVVTTFSSVLF